MVVFYENCLISFFLRTGLVFLRTHFIKYFLNQATFSLINPRFIFSKWYFIIVVAEEVYLGLRGADRGGAHGQASL